MQTWICLNNDNNNNNDDDNTTHIHSPWESVLPSCAAIANIWVVAANLFVITELCISSFYVKLYAIIAFSKSSFCIGW